MHDSVEPIPRESNPFRVDEVDSSKPTEAVSVDSPRLSIIHLFVWTAASAVYLAILRLMFSLTPHQPTTVVMASMVIMAPLQGAFLTGFLLFSYRWSRGRAFAREPGEWILVANGVNVALTLVNYLHRAAILAGWMSRLPLDRFAAVIRVAAQVVIYAVASKRLKSRPLWNRVFRVLCAIEALKLIWDLAPRLPLFSVVGGRSVLRFLTWVPPRAVLYGSEVVIGLVIGYAAVVDLRGSQRRPWTHWVGVIAAVAKGLLMAAYLNWAL